MAEQKRIVKSRAKAIALALVGVAGFLAVVFLWKLFLTYQMFLWLEAGANLPPQLRLFGYAGGVGLAVVVGLVAPAVRRLSRAFDRRFLRWLLSFGARLAAFALAMGGAMFAMECITWRPGAAALVSVGQYAGAIAAMLFGVFGAVKAMRG